MITGTACPLFNETFKPFPINVFQTDQSIFFYEQEAKELEEEKLAEEERIAMFKVKKLIKSLEAAKGRVNLHTFFSNHQKCINSTYNCFVECFQCWYKHDFTDYAAW